MTRVPAANALRERAHDGVGVEFSARNRDDVELHTMMASEVLPAVQPARVLLVRQQHTIAWSQPQSLRDRVHATGGTRGQRDLTQVTAKESRGHCACVFDQRCARVAAVVRDRVRFERFPCALRRVERCAAARTDRSGVEIREPVGK